MPSSRRHQVDGREVCVYDGLLPHEQVVVLTSMFDEGAFTRTEWARPDTAAVRHWALNIPLEVGSRLAVYEPMMRAVQELMAGKSYRIYRCYCNHASYGDVLFTHTDCEPQARDLTALWYVAPQWDVEWGGETLFYNRQADAEVAVTPRPGRLVIFDGTIQHAGRPPNRNCYAPRYTLAYKLEPAG